MNDRRSPGRVAVALQLEDVLSLLASRSRLRVIRALANGPKDVKTITQVARMPQNLVSYYLKSLHDRDLVHMTRDKTRRVYGLQKTLRVSTDDHLDDENIRLVVSLPDGAAVLVDTRGDALPRRDLIDRWLE